MEYIVNAISSTNKAEYSMINLCSVFFGIGTVLLYSLAVDYANFFNFFAIPTDLNSESSFYYVILSYELVLVTLISLAVLFLYQKILKTSLSIKILVLMQLPCALFVIAINGLTVNFSTAYDIYQNLATLYMCVALFTLGRLLYSNAKHSA